VAVTEQFPAPVPVKVDPLTEQGPLVTAYVTAPLPLPPVVLKVAVPLTLMLVELGTTVKVD